MARASSRRFVIVEPSSDGSGVQVHEMMKWCRLHPDQAPQGLSPSANTHAYACGLGRMGWVVGPREAVKDVSTGRWF